MGRAHRAASAVSQHQAGPGAGVGRVGGGCALLRSLLLLAAAESLLQPAAMAMRKRTPSQPNAAGQAMPISTSASPTQLALTSQRAGPPRMPSRPRSLPTASSTAHGLSMAQRWSLAASEPPWRPACQRQQGCSRAATTASSTLATAPCPPHLHSRRARRQPLCVQLHNGRNGRKQERQTRQAAAAPRPTTSRCGHSGAVSLAGEHATVVRCRPGARDAHISRVGGTKQQAGSLGARRAANGALMRY